MSVQSSAGSLDGGSASRTVCAVCTRVLEYSKYPNRLLSIVIGWLLVAMYDGIEV